VRQVHGGVGNGVDVKEDSAGDPFGGELLPSGSSLGGQKPAGVEETEFWIPEPRGQFS